MNNNIATIGGIMGLAKQQDRVGEQLREQATLEKLDSGIQRDKAESMAFQELESQQYEEIKKQAASLLERDRERINGVAIKFQNDINEKIREYGGRKAFYANGGTAFLKNTKSDILNSPVVLRYQKNAENMERILKVREAGKGGLLSKTDIDNLRRYDAGETDEITYSGLKSEVTLPEDHYQYGENISAYNILHYDDNYQRIYANFIIDHPDLKGLKGKQLEEQLLEYTYQNHRAIGKDKTMLQWEMAQRQLAMEQRRAQQAGTDKQDDSQVSYITKLNEMYNDAAAEGLLSVDSVMGYENQEFTGKSVIEKIRETNLAPNALLGDSRASYKEAHTPLHDSSFLSTASNFGKDVGEFFGMNNTFVPASAYKVMPADTAKLNKAVFGNVNTDGSINYALDGSNYYNADGEKLNGEAGYTTGPFGAVKKQGVGKVTGYIMAFVDQNDKMITNIADADGNILPVDEQNKRRTAYAGTPKHKLFAVMQDEDGNTIYKGFDVSNVKANSDVALALGSADNIGHTLKEANKHQDAVDNENVISQRQSRAIQQTVNEASTDKGAFALPSFNFEARTYSNGEQDRTVLLKAYYMALDEIKNGQASPKTLLSNGHVNSRSFSRKIENYETLQNAIITKGSVTDEQFMDMMAEELAKENGSVNQDHLQQNLRFAQIWKQYYKVLKQQK